MNRKPAPTPAPIAAAAQLLQVDAPKAEAQIRDYLRVSPEQPDAHLVLAVAQRLQGQAAAALDTLAKLSSLRPDWPMVEYEIGLALCQQKAWGPALVSLRRAAEFEPDLPGVWRAMGDALYELGQTAEADQAYERFVTKAGSDPLLVEAVTALQNGRADIAESHARMRLKFQPTDIVAMRLLADICAHTGRRAEAGALLAECTARAPGYIAALMEYIDLLIGLSRFEEALARLDGLLAQNPADGNLLTRQSLAYGSMGDFDRAIEIARMVVQLYPDSVESLLRLAHFLRIAGHGEEAIELFNRIIAHDPARGEAYWALASMKTYGFTDFEAEAMKLTLERKDLDDEARIAFRFSLGAALDGLGRYEEAFHSYSAANALKRMRVQFDPDGPAGVVRRAISRQTAEFFAAHRNSGTRTAAPVFIVGMPRSGSTLVEQILSSHSQVMGLGELPQLVHLAGEVVGPRSDAGYPQALEELPDEALRDLGERYLAAVAPLRRGGQAVIVDKTPVNFLHAGFIQLILPEARIIDVRRHPLACGWSNFVQLFGSGHEFSYRLTDMGRFYRDYVALMAHYDRVLPGRVHRVIYENLLADPQAEIRALLAYCGLDFEPACLAPQDNRRPVLTPSSEQVRQPVWTGDGGRWKPYDAWLGPLKTALGSVLDAYPAVPADL